MAASPPPAHPPIPRAREAEHTVEVSLLAVRTPQSVDWTAVQSSFPMSSSVSLVIRVGSCRSWGPLGSCAVGYWQNHPASFRAVAGQVTSHSVRRSKLQPYELVKVIPPWELGALRISILCFGLPFLQLPLHLSLLSLTLLCTSCGV